MEFVSYLTQNWEAISLIIIILIAVFRCITKSTPSIKDDEVCDNVEECFKNIDKNIKEYKEKTSKPE